MQCSDVWYNKSELATSDIGQDIGRSSQHCIFVSEFGYLAAFSNAGGSKLSDVINDAKFRTF